MHISLYRMRRWNMQNVSFRRYLKPKHTIDKPILILFSDASEQAFGCCAYIRWRLADNTFVVNLVAAKSRIVPMKKMSIVRLELNAGLMAKRLHEFIMSESRFDFERSYFIIDSEIVRCMIQKESYGFNTFVGLRIGEERSNAVKHPWFICAQQLPKTTTIL